jgi:hypothetical protein
MEEYKLQNTISESSSSSSDEEVSPSYIDLTPVEDGARAVPSLADDLNFLPLREQARRQTDKGNGLLRGGCAGDKAIYRYRLWRHRLWPDKAVVAFTRLLGQVGCWV